MESATRAVRMSKKGPDLRDFDVNQKIVVFDAITSVSNPKVC